MSGDGHYFPNDTTDRNWVEGRTRPGIEEVLFEIDDADAYVAASGESYGNVMVVGFATSIALSNGVIPTESFLAGSDSGAYGLVYASSNQRMNLKVRSVFDAGAEASLEALYSLGVGGRSETIEDILAAGGIGDDSTTEGGDILATAGLDIIANYSIGLGFMNMITTYDAMGDLSFPAAAFFTYGNDSIGAPTTNIPDSAVTTTDDGTWVSDQTYTKPGAYVLDELERQGLNLKFGHPAGRDSIGLAMESETSPLLDELSSSMTGIVQNIITTFPENILSFARTKPMRLKHSDIYAIETDEQIEDTLFTAEATSPTTGGSSDY